MPPPTQLESKSLSPPHMTDFFPPFRKQPRWVWSIWPYHTNTTPSFLNNQRHPLLDVCGLTCGHSLGLFLPIKTTFFSIATFFSPYTPLRGRNERGGIGNHYHIHAIVSQLSPSISFFNQTAELLLACKYSPYNSRFWPHQIEVFKYRPRHTQLIPIF